MTAEKIAETVLTFIVGNISVMMVGVLFVWIFLYVARMFGVRVFPKRVFGETLGYVRRVLFYKRYAKVIIIENIPVEVIGELHKVWGYEAKMRVKKANNIPYLFLKKDVDWYPYERIEELTEAKYLGELM